MLRFDFNNLMDFNVGPEHGVSREDIEALEKEIGQAHRHLTGLLKDEKQRIACNLEWTQLPFQDKQTVGEIEQYGVGIAAHYENVLFLGIGGSYLGLKAAQDALAAPYYNEFTGGRSKKPRLYYEGNNLDPETLNTLLDNLDPKKTFVVVISKSGETTETKAAFDIVREWLSRIIGPHYGRQICAITDPASGSLRALVRNEQAKDPKSFRSFPLLPGVGGRYSELNMGLLHLALLGVPVMETLEGAGRMYRRCLSGDIYANPALFYAAAHHILYRDRGKTIAVLMPFSEGLKSTADWYVQLLAESLGKKGAGRTPVSARGTNDLHSIQQNNVQGENNKAVTFIRVEEFRTEAKIPDGGGFLAGKSYTDLMKTAQEATEWALVREQRPNCTIVMPRVTPHTWGQLLMFFEMAVAYEGELQNVNAYDQPGVESYKQYMYYKLGKPGISPEVIGEIEAHPVKKEGKYIL